MRRLTVLLLTFLATIRRGGWDGLVSIAETYRSSWNDIAAGHAFAAALTVSIWICETGTWELSSAPQSADRDDSGSSRRNASAIFKSFVLHPARNRSVQPVIPWPLGFGRCHGSPAKWRGAMTDGRNPLRRDQLSAGIRRPALHAAVCCRRSLADRPTDRSASRRIDKPSSTSASVETIGGTRRMILVRPSLPRA